MRCGHSHQTLLFQKTCTPVAGVVVYYFKMKNLRCARVEGRLVSKTLHSGESVYWAGMRRRSRNARAAGPTRESTLGSAHLFPDLGDSTEDPKEARRTTHGGDGLKDTQTRSPPCPVHHCGGHAPCSPDSKRLSSWPLGSRESSGSGYAVSRGGPKH